MPSVCLTDSEFYVLLVNKSRLAGATYSFTGLKSKFRGPRSLSLRIDTGNENLSASVLYTTQEVEGLGPMWGRCEHDDVWL